MNRRLLLFVLVSVLIVGASCRHKPSYSDIETSGSTKNKNEAPAAPDQAQSAGAQSAPAEPTAPASQPPAATTEPPKKFVVPSFVDQQTGEAKDLPSYPNAMRVNIQIGPVEG